jgi:hypothetical protein
MFESINNVRKNPRKQCWLQKSFGIDWWKGLITKIKPNSPCFVAPENIGKPCLNLCTHDGASASQSWNYDTWFSNEWSKKVAI